MSEHLLVVLLALLVTASAGLLLSAAVLGWRQDRLRHQQAVERHRRLVAIRRTQRKAERHIDHLTVAALESLVAATQTGDRQ
ncbi:hypothetical protein [Mycobacteroides saopaulense]|uniref:Uncharacterized protein n=1 Tax=Mycobacteroides saopaulense TaxID=1578165 RepID=A0ABX3C5V5_9MYCO|nr:hypothetical protein [Mycobacteroides saopaulense]OHT89054.1 hypothetical protein BKG68_04170 [Mycobacteroides saopaulense]OHU13875.1 hypothetical protein BKG73_04180 [Mycobacteroides saopaulense]